MSGAKKIIINNSIGETRAAVTTGDEVCDIRLFRDHTPSYVGTVFLGRVASLSKEMQAAHVDLGDGLTGYLPLKTLPKTPGKKPKDLTELLHEGQRVIVQVTADAVGDKGAKLTGKVELIAPSLVFHPFRAGAYVSSRIKDPDRREDLKQFGRTLDLNEYGLTFRTNAELMSNDNLTNIARNMILHWQDITRDIKNKKCPSLLTQGPNAIEQILREFASPDIDEILFDQVSDIAVAKIWAQGHAPDLTDKISQFKDGRSIFSHFEIEDDLEKLYSTRVPLKSGAWITIEHTEAMTVVDVNMGSAQFSNDQQKQIFSLNREAAREIFRQIRLRSIGGIIVIDFVDMTNKGDVKSLLHFVDELMLNDPEPIQRGNISSFGLLELTRRSRQLSLGAQLLKTRQTDKSVTSMCLDLLRNAERDAANNPGIPQVITVNKEMKNWFEQNSVLFDEFQKRTGSTLKMEQS